MKTLLTSLALLLALAIPALAEHEEHTPAPGHTEAAEHHPDPEPHPAIPADPSWAPTMLQVIAIMFVAAIGVGLAYRAFMSEEPPAADPHHDDAHGDDAHGHEAGHGHATGHH